MYSMHYTVTYIQLYMKTFINTGMENLNHDIFMKFKIIVNFLNREWRVSKYSAQLNLVFFILNYAPRTLMRPLVFVL